MMPSSLRRAAIVGGGVGGLSAAIHLRLAGFEVTVYEANGRVGGRANLIEGSGFRFDTGPSLLNYPWVFRDLFHAAGRRLEDYVTLLPVDPAILFLWPDGTHLQLTSDLRGLAGEMERLEPGSSPGLTRFLADAEAKYAFAFAKLAGRNADHVLGWFAQLSPREMLRSAVWRSLHGELGRFFRSPRLRDALGSYAMYLGGSPWQLPGLFSILPYGELAYGLWLPKGGMYALVAAIEKLARELGVEVATRRRVRTIRAGNGLVAGLEFADGTVEDWPVVVSNVDVPTTRAELLPEGPRRDAARRANRRLAMTPGVVTFYWGLRGRPHGLGHHTIFLPDDFRANFDDLLVRRRMPEHPAFYVSIASDTDPSLAPEEHSTLFALSATPLLSEMGTADRDGLVAALRGRIIERLGTHGIRIREEEIVFERHYTPDDWRRLFGLYDGSAFGAAHTLFQLGPFRPPNRDPRLAGLYYTGASTTPGTGLPIVVLSGRMTAERVIADVR